jgi:hypothetical protein
MADTGIKEKKPRNKKEEKFNHKGALRKEVFSPPSAP